MRLVQLVSLIHVFSPVIVAKDRVPGGTSTAGTACFLWPGMHLMQLQCWSTSLRNMLCTRLKGNTLLLSSAVVAHSG